MRVHLLNPLGRTRNHNGTPTIPNHGTFQHHRKDIFQRLQCQVIEAYFRHGIAVLQLS